MVIEKLATVLTSFGVPFDIIDKIKSILGDANQKQEYPDQGKPSDEETPTEDEAPKEDKMGMVPEWEEKVDAMNQMDDPKRKLSLKGVKVVCISE
mgnify:CR=1 FL=1